jgi:hypothetical protein
VAITDYEQDSIVIKIIKYAMNKNITCDNLNDFLSQIIADSEK